MPHLRAGALLWVCRAEREARAASRANGTQFGRPRKVHGAKHIATAKRMKADGHTGRAR